MSNANELHNAIMEVVMSYMRDKKCTHADVFGALFVCKSFFEVEYAATIASAFRKALNEDEALPTDEQRRAL